MKKQYIKTVYVPKHTGKAELILEILQEFKVSIEETRTIHHGMADEVFMVTLQSHDFDELNRAVYFFDKN